MSDVLTRARAMYADAHHADDVQRFDDAIAGFRALLALLDAADLDGEDRDGGVLRVRALLGIARATYESRGDLPSAMEALAQAEEHAARCRLEAELLAVQGMRGLLLLRSGDAPAALAALDAVAPPAGAPPTRDLAVTLLNRGALHLEYGDPAAAGADLSAAAQTAAAAGEPNLEAMARHNLGLMRFVQGDLPAALREMGEAADLGDTPSRSHCSIVRGCSPRRDWSRTPWRRWTRPSRSSTAAHCWSAPRWSCRGRRA